MLSSNGGEKEVYGTRKRSVRGEEPVSVMFLVTVCILEHGYCTAVF